MNFGYTNKKRLALTVIQDKKIKIMAFLYSLNDVIKGFNIFFQYLEN